MLEMGPEGNNTLVSPLNNLLYRNVQQSNESQSEASSSAESNWSDINSIALQMGVNPEDLVIERFKVDRQKLENMIKDSSATEGVNAAERFFDNITERTSTRINWPCRLKINAKTKKDPHVRIVGKPLQVNQAKDMILDALDSRGCRVIMKMDISYTDHSYIIGRGGNNIKKIMEDTLTHIHFPDSNRSSSTEKSNQVSLYGSLEGVEKARALVRFSTPLIISFEVPTTIPGRPMPNNNTEYVKGVQDTYNVQVIFTLRPKFNPVVLVKGCEREADKVRDAARSLCFHMRGSSQIQVNMQLKISPQHHDIVKGRNNMHILSIMEQTNTKIIFPDLSDVNIKPLDKSQVTITGSIDDVYKAKQQLIGNLPVALIFDYPENSVKEEEIKTLNNKFGVFIAARQKSRQSTLCIVIKGVEKYVDKIYEARRTLLNLHPSVPMPKVEIPASYFASNEQDFNSSMKKNLVDILSSVPNSPLTPGSMLQNFTPTFLNASTFQNQLDNRGFLSNLTSHNLRLHATILKQENLHQLNQNQNLATNLEPNLMASYTAGRSNASPRSTSANTSGYISNPGNICNLNISNSSNITSNSLEQLLAPYKNSIQLNGNSLNYFPENQMFGSASNGILSHPLNEGAHFDTDNRLITPNYHQTGTSDFDRKRMEGFKAIERFDLKREEIRTPTNAWTGFSLSQTSPFALESTSNDLSQWTQRDKLDFDKMSTTGLIYSVPWSQRESMAQCKDIQSLLYYLKLEHYISVFIREDIDIETFTMLSDKDLVDLNIKAFGARKRLMLAIKDLKAKKLPQCDWVRLSDFKDICSLLAHLKLEHYINNFVVKGIDIGMFAMLNREDLIELNINRLGAQIRLLWAINQLKAEMQPFNEWIQLSEFKDIDSLLHHLKLDHHITNFIRHEIDLKTFVTLTAQDLTELGVESFNERKQLLVAINQLKSERFVGSAAPGAERRASNDGW